MTEETGAAHTAQLRRRWNGVSKTDANRRANPTVSGTTRSERDEERRDALADAAGHDRSYTTTTIGPWVR